MTFKCIHTAVGLELMTQAEASKNVEVDVLPRDTHNPRQFFIELSAPVNAVIDDSIGECRLIPAGRSARSLA